jgi:hypothetical protein
VLNARTAEHQLDDADVHAIREQQYPYGSGDVVLK